jgi:hypothetical protein
VPETDTANGEIVGKSFNASARAVSVGRPVCTAEKKNIYKIIFQK